MDWISVKEAQPEPIDYDDMKFCLVTDGVLVEFGAYDEDEGWLMNDRGMMTPFSATHWMPLPNPPVRNEVTGSEIE